MSNDAHHPTMQTVAVLRAEDFCVKKASQRVKA
jgi:hypothetical protein